MSPKRAHDEASSEGEFKRQEKVPRIFGVEKIVVVKIPSGEEFWIHAHLLVQHSDYFLRALNSGMAEASSLEFALEHDPLQNVRQARPQLDIEHFNLPEAWLLADYLRVQELQNDIMERFFSRRFALARISAQDAVHPPTPPGHMLFKFQYFFVTKLSLMSRKLAKH
ncbi:hypothetical protein Micbo1qcDRAFT_177608 [Microdochium bolleyi]|uniref:BTB domain-containing protein n=1 Tax=Microdochium bolleyi TaxID=196109 RepID=A0A136IW78_9PEZI|nr:hypothetical protein Micbo1qcDRAFT_177608 [Microdochium bolleyi]